MWPRVCFFSFLVFVLILVSVVLIFVFFVKNYGLGVCFLCKRSLGSSGWRLGSPGFFLLKIFFVCCQICLNGLFIHFFEWSSLSSRFNTPSCFSLPDSSSCVAQVPEQDVFIFRDFLFSKHFLSIFACQKMFSVCRTAHWQPDRASSSGTTAVPASPMCAQVNILKPHQTQHAPTPLVRGLDPNCPQIVYSQVQLFLWSWSGEVCWERKHRQVRNITRGMSWVSGGLVLYFL